MDGLPGLPRAMIAGKREKVAPIKKMVGPLAPTQYRYMDGYTPTQMVAIAMVAFLMGVALTPYMPMLVEVGSRWDAGSIRQLMSHVSV